MFSKNEVLISKNQNKMAKNIDLTSQKWIDLIFEGRNKSFGSYVLRQQSSKRHTFAFLIVMALSLLTIVSAVSISNYNKAREIERIANEEKIRLIDVNLKAPEEIPEENIVKKFEAPPPVELKTTIQFTAPVIKKDEDVPAEQMMKSQDELISTNTTISIADVVGRDDDLGVDIADLEQHQKIVQEEVKVEKVFDIVEQPPSFPGGDAAMYEWLSKNIVYPVIAQENDISGKVILQFVVCKDGSIENISIARKVHESLDREAVRVVSSMPKWLPGKQGGNPIKVKYTLPVMFELR